MPNNSAATDIIQTIAPRLTVSAVGDLRCPAKFKLLRIDRIWKKRDVILAVAHGKATHQAAHDLYAERVGGILDLSNLEAVCRGAVRNTWYPRDANRDEQVQRVMGAVRGFIEADDEEDIEGILALEVQGEFPVRLKDGLVLCVISAKLDCLLVRKSQADTLVIRERKTTAQRVDLKECYIQMRIAKKMHPTFKNIIIEFDWLDEDNRVFRDTVTMAEVKGQHQIVMGLAYKVLTGNDYPAVPGDGVCRFCPKREACQSLPPDVYTEASLQRMAERLQA